jgi:hypothetical protein
MASTHSDPLYNRSRAEIGISEYPMNIFYIIGVIVVILFVAGFFGLHA